MNRWAVVAVLVIATGLLLAWVSVCSSMPPDGLGDELTLFAH